MCIIKIVSRAAASKYHIHTPEALIFGRLLHCYCSQQWLSAVSLLLPFHSVTSQVWHWQTTKGIALRNTGWNYAENVMSTFLLLFLEASSEIGLAPVQHVQASSQ